MLKLKLKFETCYLISGWLLLLNCFGWEIFAMSQTSLHVLENVSGHLGLFIL